MKTRKDVGYLWVMLIASLLCLSSCEDRSDEINTPEEALENRVLDNSTEYDVVEQVYNEQEYQGENILFIDKSYIIFIIFSIFINFPLSFYI